MNRCLPARDEYYRPTHARELRRRANRCEKWARRLRHSLVQVFIVYGVSIPLTIWIHSFAPLLWIAPFCVVVALGVALSLPPTIWWLDDRERGLRKKATELDADHSPRNSYTAGAYHD